MFGSCRIPKSFVSQLEVPWLNSVGLPANGAIAATKATSLKAMSANSPTLRRTKVEGDGGVHEGREDAARRLRETLG